MKRNSSEIQNIIMQNICKYLVYLGEKWEQEEKLNFFYFTDCKYLVYIGEKWEQEEKLNYRFTNL